jgi:hypothetical protein
MYSGDSPTFRTNTSPPSSESKSKPNKKWAVACRLLLLVSFPEDWGEMYLRNVGFFPNYTSSQPLRPYCSETSPWEHQLQRLMLSSFVASWPIRHAFKKNSTVSSSVSEQRDCLLLILFCRSRVWRGLSWCTWIPPMNVAISAYFRTPCRNSSAGI